MLNFKQISNFESIFALSIVGSSKDNSIIKVIINNKVIYNNMCNISPNFKINLYLLYY